MGILLLRSSITEAPATFDFYIGPSGSDSNDGLTTSTPWAITAINTKRTTYRGNRVGLLDGTYNIYDLIQAGDDGGYEPALNIDGGTVSGSTVIQSVNERQAIIECREDGTTHPDINNPAIGQYATSQMGYVELRGLVIQGAGSKGVYLGNYGVADTTSTRYDGYVVDSCEFTAQSCAAFGSGGNYACLETAGMRGGQVTNNYFHDNVGQAGATNGNHCSSTLQWYGEENLYEYNTCIDSPGLYGKEHGNFGSTVRYNYVDTTGWTEVWGAQDFNDDSTDTHAETTHIHNNIFIAPQAADLRSTLGASPFRGPVKFEHNTLIVKASGQSLGLCGHFNAGVLSCYGNIIYSEASDDMDLICVNTTADGLIDYDLYYSTTGTYVYGWFTSTTDGTRNGTSTFATWQSTMGGTPEANSVRGSDPLFVASGSRADYYKLQSGSPAKNASKSDGTSGGSTCDMGAWGGPSPPTRIGSDF